MILIFDLTTLSYCAVLISLFKKPNPLKCIFMVFAIFLNFTHCKVPTIISLSCEICCWINFAPETANKIPMSYSGICIALVVSSDLQWAAVLFVNSYAETRNINHLDRMNNRASKTQKKPLIKIGPVTIWNRVILAALPGASGQCSGCAAAHVIFWT